MLALSDWNLTLGLFNLLPAPPLDGGRVLVAHLEGRYGLVGAYWGYTVGLWTAAIGAVGSGLLGSTLALVIFVLCCQTSHLLRNGALQRLGYRPRIPFRVSLPRPFRRWSERKAAADVKSQLEAIVARHNQELKRDQATPVPPYDDSRRSP